MFVCICTCICIYTTTLINNSHKYFCMYECSMYVQLKYNNRKNWSFEYTSVYIGMYGYVCIYNLFLFSFRAFLVNIQSMYKYAFTYTHT